jgi:hypothetical protein
VAGRPRLLHCREYPLMFDRDDNAYILRSCRDRLWEGEDQKYILFSRTTITSRTCLYTPCAPQMRSCLST